MRLDRDDVNLTDQVLTVRNSKFGRSREVLCHRSTVEALFAYADRRDGLCTDPRSASFFVSTRGTRLTHSTIHRTFQLLLRQTGLDQRPGVCRPRVHDFRHTFAVNSLLRWYRDGIDVQARMPLLSTYLGHINPAATYLGITGITPILGLFRCPLLPARKRPGTLADALWQLSPVGIIRCAHGISSSP